MRSSGRPGDLPPQRGGLVVVLVDGDPQVLRVEAEAAVRLGGGQQLPRVGDRALFEVVAERPVAEHLEERAVPRRLADLFDVVRADALLDVGGTRVRRGDVAAQVRDERHHARDREQQRRVVGDQRRRRHDGVVALLEVAEEAVGELSGLHGVLEEWRCPREGHRLTGGSVGELLARIAAFAASAVASAASAAVLLTASTASAAVLLADPYASFAASFTRPRCRRSAPPARGRRRRCDR